jgi:hypothetical protein
MIDFQTRGDNILDLFLTNRPSLVQRCRPIPGVSDHDVVLVQAQTTATRAKPPKRKILLWKNADTTNIHLAIKSFSCELTSKYHVSTNIDTLWNTFRDFVINTEGLSHSKAKATILNRQFSSVFTTENQSTLPSLGPSPHPDMHNFTVTAKGVYKLQRDLDPYKATGPDQIPTKFLKDYAEELSPSLALIFQASLN